MARLTVPCPDCGYVITLEIASIDRMRQEIARLEQKCAALELKQRAAPRDEEAALKGFFEGLFGGKE